MIVYADVFFFENFIVNMFLLTITVKFLKHKCKVYRLLLSACIGGIYSFVLIVPKLNILGTMPFELITAYIMLRLVCGKTKFFSILKALIIFLMVTFTLSGLCFLISLKQNYYVLGGIFKIEKYSIKYIILSLMCIYVFSSRIIDYIRDKITVNNYVYTMEFQIDGKEYSFRSFLDTGNELREPVTNLPCILIEEKFFPKINLNNKNMYNIPYNSIGCGGNLKGVRVNDINIKGGDFWNRQVDAIVCPCVEKLSKEDEFNALLSRGIL